VESEDSDAFTNFESKSSGQSEERYESTIVQYVEPLQKVQTTNRARLQTEELDAFTKDGYEQEHTRQRLETEESDAFMTFQSRPSNECSASVESSVPSQRRKGPVMPSAVMPSAVMPSAVVPSAVATTDTPRSQLEADLVCSTSDSELTKRIINPPRIRSGAAV
jgi:hypothetical protein